MNRYPQGNVEPRRGRGLGRDVFEGRGCSACGLGRGERNEVVSQRGGPREKRQQGSIREVDIARDRPVVRGKVNGIGGGKQTEECENGSRGGEKERKGRGEMLELGNDVISEKGRGEFIGKGRVRIPRGTRLRGV